MATLDELLPLIDALSADEKRALADHLSRSTAPEPTATIPPKKRVIHHPSGRGGAPMARIVMPNKRPK
jgi:hypothetical protein